MVAPAVRVTQLGKKYRIGLKASRSTSFRELLTNCASANLRSFRRRSAAEEAPEDFWALNDISFEVQPGEVVGIIGHNGSGKSTLLKVLSQITEPTRGTIELNGRVACLLEVGTGFHPELTGRENIYLNGAMLGMRHAEIRHKFDEIVAFSEVEKFLDTPVKRYSSGMYMRLAFSVAAHLEPEILIIDEVLAVGDSAFQAKCLGKMHQVAGDGRTVLFVSHNMQAVRSLCQSVYQLEGGRILRRGNTADVIAAYLSGSRGTDCEKVWADADAPGTESFKLRAVRARSAAGASGGTYSSRDGVCVEMEFETRSLDSATCVGFDLINSEGITVFRSYQTDQAPEDWPELRLGINRWLCRIPSGLLNGGLYHVCPRISLHNMSWIVHLDGAVQFEVMLDHGISPMWNSLSERNRNGVISPIFEWSRIEDRQ